MKKIVHSFAARSSRAVTTNLPIALSAVVLLTSCSGDNTGTKEPRTGLHYVSKVSFTDTVDALLPERLIVEMRDDAGKPIANKGVKFFIQGQFQPDTTKPSATLSLTIGDVSSGTSNATNATTDANGQVSATVHFGNILGNVVVTALIEGTQLNDFAAFTVVPGAPASVTLQPRDTVAYAAARVVYRLAFGDRYRNPVFGSVPVPFTTNNDLTVASNGVATPRLAGRDTIIARIATIADTVFLSVLPTTGVLAASLPPTTPGVMLINLDGSGYRELATNTGLKLPYAVQRPRFTYDGKNLIVRIAQDTEAHLWVVPIDGSVPRRLMPNSTTTNEDWPTPSPDNQWIYFTSTDKEILRRVHIDGTGLEDVPVEVPPPSNFAVHEPAISSNSGMVAWQLSGIMKTRNIATGTRLGFEREGYAPAWAPTGMRIAYIKGNPGPIYSSEFNGTDDRLIAPGVYGGPLTWTPDGKLLLAFRYISGTVMFYEMVDPISGTTFPMKYKIGDYAVVRPF